MYRAGNVDWTVSVPSDQYKALSTNKKYKSELHVAPWLALAYYSINFKKAPFNHLSAHQGKDLRQALSLAVDRKAVAHDILGQGQIPAYSFVPKNTNGVRNIQYSWAHWPMQRKLKKSRDLFKAAGFNTQHPLKLAIIYPTRGDNKKIAIATLSMWQQAFGNALQAKIENEEWKVWISDFTQGHYQMSLTDWVGDYKYATTFLNLYQCNNPQNTGHYCNKKLNELMDKAANSSSKLARIHYNNEAERVAMQDYAVIPIYQYVITRLIKPYVKGYSTKHVLDHIHTKYLSMTENPKR